MTGCLGGFHCRFVEQSDLQWSVVYGPKPLGNLPEPHRFTVFDSFSDFPNVWNAFHEPDLAPEFRGWTVNNGAWLADFAQLTETTGEKSDQRIVIDTGVEDSLISTDLTWQSGRSGITFRYRDEKNWAMAWYNGFGELILGKVVQGRFSVVDRFPLEVKPGKAIKLVVWTTDDIAHVRVDNTYLQLVVQGCRLTQLTTYGMFLLRWP